MGVTVLITSNKFTFELELKYKVSRITGLSGTKKTTVWDTIRSINSGDGADLEITCDIAVQAIPLRTAQDQSRACAPNYVDTVLIFDEDVVYAKPNEFISCIERSRGCYFLFINRACFGWLSYSYKAIYQLHEVSSNKFKMRQVYTDEVIKHNISNFNRVVTEDSCSGYQLFSELFSIPVIAACGKEKIVNSAEDALSIVDGSAFGSVIEDFTSRVFSYILYLPESFEWLLLDADVMRYKDLTDEEFRYEGFQSFERFCEKLVSNIAVSYGITYNKSHLHKILKSPANLRKIRKYLLEHLERGVAPDVEYDILTRYVGLPD